VLSLLLCVALVAAIPRSASPEPAEEDIEHMMFDLEEASPEERDEMVREFWRLTTPAAAPALLTVLATINEEDLPLTRDLAERYACRLADKRVIPVCRDMLDSDDPQVRRYAARVLAFAGDPAAVALIKRAIEDPERSVRSAAIGALGYTRDPSLVPFLEKLCKSPDSHVSGAAQFALRTLKWQTGQRPREDFATRVWPKRTIVQVGRNSFWRQWRRTCLHTRLAVRTFDASPVGEAFREALGETRLLFFGTNSRALQDDLLRAEENRQAISALLKSGGTIVFDNGLITREMEKFLASVQVRLPLGEKRTAYSAVPSEEEVHSLTAWPLKVGELVSESDGAVCWEHWHASQCAPYRSQSEKRMAAMVVQENVLGAGRVIFNGIPGMYDTGQRHCDMLENLLATAFNSPDRTLYYFFRLLHDFQTPRWECARPWGGPKLRLLVIGDQYIKRDVVEMCQRTDMLDFTYATLVERREGPYGRNSNKLEGASVVDLQQKIAGDYDLYLIARRGRAITRKHWELVPEDVRRIIVRRVLRGAGLFILGSGAGTGKEEKPDLEIPEIRGLEVLEDDYQFTVGTLPYELGSKRRGRSDETTMRLRECGKGRVVLMSDFPRPGPEFESPVLFNRFMRFRPHDYRYSLFLKTLLWAGRKEPTLQIRSITPEATPVGQFQPPVVVLNLLNRDKQALRLTVEAEAVNRVNEVAGRAKQHVSLDADQEKEVRVALPPLPSGPHVARVCLRTEDGKAVNWASTGLMVATAVDLTEAKWDRPVYREGETLKAELKVSGEVPGPGADLQASLVDSRGRLLAEKTVRVAVKQKSVPLELTFGEPVVTLADLRLKLVHERGPLAAEQFPVTFTWPRKDLRDFKWYVWRNAGNGEERWATASLDVDYAHTGHETAENSLRYSGAVYTLSFDRLAGPAGGGPGTSRRPCYQNTNYHYRVMERVREFAPHFLTTGIRDIMLEDEASIGGKYCFCPTCAFHFRAWAQRTHKTLGRLNAEWGTEFKHWEDVRGADLNGLKDPNHPGAWLDHRRYMDSVFSARIRRYREAIQTFDPDATIGMSGTQRQSPSNNYDWWQLCHAGNLWLAYGGAQTKLRRSFKTGKTVMAQWGGGYNRADDGEVGTRRRMWWLVLNRYDAYAYYWGGSDAFIMLEPDFSPINMVVWTRDEVLRLKRGLAEMLLRSQLETFGIGMHYSVSSQYSAYPTKRLQPGRPGHVDGMLSLGMPLEDLRRQFTYVAYQEIEMGELMRRKFRLLLLPNSQAISRREAEEIRKFVQAGGTAVVDFGVAERNEHGTLLEMGQLEDVFGLRVSKPTCVFRKAKLELTQPFGAVQPGPHGEFSAPFDNGLTPTTAAPHGVLKADGKSAPALLVNSFGKGKAVYLNFSFAGYGALRVAGFGGELSDVERLKAEQGARIRALAAALMEISGMPREVEWARADSQTDFSEVYVYRNGPLTYIGVLPGTYQPDPVDWEKKDDYELRLPEKAFVYDARNGGLLANAQVVPVKPVTGIPSLYAALPYEVKAVKAEAEGASPGQKVRISLDVVTSGPKPAEHILHVTVRDPRGRLRPEYRQNVVAAEGRGKMTFPLALNDPVGEWTAAARDAATGVTGEVKVAVRK